LGFESHKTPFPAKRKQSYQKRYVYLGSEEETAGKRKSVAHGEGLPLASERTTKNREST